MSPESSALTAEGTAAYRREVEEAASALRERLSGSPDVGILNNTALDKVLDEGTVETSVPCADLPHYPAAEGTLTVERLSGTQVVIMDQRLHLYEGDSPRVVTFPVRVLAEAGVEILLLPATASSVNPQFTSGDLMLVTDHINLQGQNPLVGPNVEQWGPRFPDMTEPYAPRLQQVATDVAQENGVSLQKGVYLAMLGPNAETTAEHRMVRRLGADAAGTDVVPEVIAARHMGVQVLSVVLLTEQHLGERRPPSSPTDDQDALGRGRSHLRRLLTGVVSRAVGTAASR